MNVHLTDELEAFVHQKVESGLYKSASEVVREALRLLAKRDADELLERLLLEGLDSGAAQALTHDWWEKKRHVLNKRLSERRKSEEK